VDDSLLITNAGVRQLLKIARDNMRITQIRIDEVESHCEKGKLNPYLWAAVQDACEVRVGCSFFVGLGTHPYLVFVVCFHFGGNFSIYTCNVFVFAFFFPGQRSSCRNLSRVP
jgi:hypothetical protein